MAKTKTKNFVTSFSALLAQAVRAINRYSGPKAVTLATGEMAIDFDDSWLIIGRPSGGRRLGIPVLRNKRDQRGLERAGAEGKPYQPSWEDEIITKAFEPYEIFRLANSLQTE